ncbi:N-acetylmuramoyl-L-alanine amidase [Lachnobacterium bovis]|uniref:N-acetylmuramoyl-L-alanine amidase n=1 Tax=Lachnobacterium bovis TaxID=140626 RepID=UPI00068C0050|nr:N-acetylmuramoyl-L-alanine amidase [Lachnobacterium bovis]
MEKRKLTRSEYIKIKKRRQQKRKILRAGVYTVYYGFWTILIALIFYFSYSFITSKFKKDATSIGSKNKDIVMYNYNSYDTDNTVVASTTNDASNKNTSISPNVTDNKPRKQDFVDDGKLIVCIDAGHGGKDIGCNSKKRNEKNDTLKIALEVQKYLKSKKVKVILTRSNDYFISLQKRVDICSEKKCDYFISIHRNCGNGSGYETWTSSDANEESKYLANSIHSGLVDIGISKDRGVKSGSQKSSKEDYFVLRNTTTPACLLELGFLNNYNDNKYFDSNKKKYSKAIGDAIIDTYNQYHEKK